MRSRLAPYLLVLPGGFWLALFFIVPMAAMVNVSLQTGSLETGFQQSFDFHTYVDMISTYHVQLLRSLTYGLVTTLIAIVLAYP
jgi:spermidine/putrescine transport system permease protein